MAISNNPNDIINRIQSGTVLDPPLPPLKRGESSKSPFLRGI